MVDRKTGRGSTRLDALASALEQKLENESGVLDLLLAAHARGGGSRRTASSSAR
jgi:hypothetical protein